MASIKFGQAEFQISNDTFNPDRYEIRIEHEGTGDEGGSFALQWINNLTRAQLREIGTALINFADEQEL